MERPRYITWWFCKLSKPLTFAEGHFQLHMEPTVVIRFKLLPEFPPSGPENCRFSFGERILPFVYRKADVGTFFCKCLLNVVIVRGAGELYFFFTAGENADLGRTGFSNARTKRERWI